jgi:hypothetical protein
VGAEEVDQVGVQAAALEAAGGVCGQQPGDALLAGLGLAAEAELAVDDRAAQRALGVVVGRLDAVVVGERPQRGPDLQDVAREASALAVAGLLAGVLWQDRLEFAPQRADSALEPAAIAGVLEDLPCPEHLVADPQAVFAELLFGPAALGVEGEVALQVRPADLSSADG